MKKESNRVFYRTDAAVKKGDEFYQIVWKHFPELKVKGFRVEVFHGVAGKPPKKVESDFAFDTQKAADDKINGLVAEIEGRGFVRYSPLIHGDRIFESRR
ncbi:MAG: hypothetical protein ABSG60_00365 [Terracidiphilus sp.]|jgi:hypothetical protein